jgi:cytochrome c biogenesis protein CcmG, thiol:disulfide interchange protein DsbE
MKYLTKPWLIGLSLLAFFFLLGFRLINPQHTLKSPLSNLQPYSSLSKMDEINGRQFNLKPYMGKPLLIHFWASWCAVCKNEFPTLHEIRNIPLIGVAYKDSRADVDLIIQEKGSPFKHLILDQDGLIGIDFGVRGTPETFLIDANGAVIARWQGALGFKEIESINAMTEVR